MNRVPKLRPMPEPLRTDDVSPALPDELRAGIDELVGQADRRRLEAAASRLSDAYRAKGLAAARAAHTREDVAAYAAYRAPATYAAAVAVLIQVRLLRPGWQPHSVLDVGAGPGVASWAAAAVWPGIARFMLVDAEGEMIGAGQALAQRAPQPALAAATWIQGDVTAEAGSADLILASYLLGELEEARVRSVVSGLWAHTDDTAVFIEPGTPTGYQRALSARTTILAEGGFTLAPCPHDATCPLAADDWCHFATRLPRGEAHRAVKRVSRGFEDEKYSYAVLCRSRERRATARIIRPPQLRSGHLYLESCETEGVERRIVARRDGDAYRRARKLGWGDALAVEDDRPGNDEAE